MLFIHFISFKLISFYIINKKNATKRFDVIDNLKSQWFVLTMILKKINFQNVYDFKKKGPSKNHNNQTNYTKKHFCFSQKCFDVYLVI